MVTRLSAAMAREKVKKVKLEIAQRKREAETIRNAQLIARLELAAAWEAQKNKIIDAAVDGADFFSGHTVCLPKELLILGFQISERGLFSESIEEKNKSILLEYINDIFRFFEEFACAFRMNECSNDQQLVNDFCTFCLRVLNVAISDQRTDKPNLRKVLVDGLPCDLCEKYAIYLDKIINAYDAYQFNKLDMEALAASYGQHSVLDLAPGRRSYSVDDNLGDMLVPTQSGNIFEVSWHSDYQNTYFSQQLFCNEGIFWLSKINGQYLINQIFDALGNAAAKGRSKYTIFFKLQEHVWYFQREKGKNVFSCIPDDLIEIIRRQGFKIYDTCATEHSYRIKVGW